MALKLYRRHRKECEGGHPEDARSGEFEEGAAGKSARASFTSRARSAGSSTAKQTGKSDWDEAKALVASWEMAGAWEGKVEPAPPPPVPPPVPGRITIADATKVFLSNREGAKIAHATLRKYKTFTKQLTAFADSHGYTAALNFLKDQLQKLELKCSQIWKCKCTQQTFPTASDCAKNCPPASLRCIAPTCLWIDPATGKWTGRGI